jgi:KEOPS complex subunit Cgi121
MPSSLAASQDTAVRANGITYYNISSPLTKSEILKSRPGYDSPMAVFEVLGARGRVDDPPSMLEVLRGLGEGAAMDADMVCGRDHLRSAAMHARRSFDRGANACSTLGVETVLYASGERQISKAVIKMGLRPGTERIALALFDADVDAILQALGLQRDDDVLEPSEEKSRRFGITEAELRAVPPDRYPDLVLERVAFVDLSK